ncbi:hypothetical protein WPS_18470 [Vulcanimicrobium alpinum]|uniref:Thioesterase domain-containing protein n=1 Tax=Vulcanimicrobium alpinum TaxID=3016050 RepID=A0AAN1XWA5_UNVUL|nr:PaaI family thioesterase [Vulcanimicrobium alpinum]BDE06571.1 hypothetical protein WPS_18470 [Vulcanimicrobium alpinum]
MQATRERLVRWEDPLSHLAGFEGMTGLQALQAIVEGRVPPPPIANLMDFTIVEVDQGRAVFEGLPGEHHYNPIGSVHGAFALALFDSAMSCAIHTLLDVGVGYTTTDVQVRFIRGISKDSGPIRCEGTALHVGRSTAVAEGKLYDGSRKLLGIGTTACAILRR